MSYECILTNYSFPKATLTILWWMNSNRLLSGSMVQAVPLRFLSIILASSGPPSSKSSSLTFPSPLASISIPSTGVDEIVKEGVVRWRLRLHFFAYETLGDMRINELFDIIVDYPER